MCRRLLFLFVVYLLLGGCDDGPATRGAAEPGSAGAAVEIAGDEHEVRVEHRTDRGPLTVRTQKSTVGSDGTLQPVEAPALPPPFRLPAHARMMAVTRLTGPEGKRIIADFTTDAAPADVMVAFRLQARAAGFATIADLDAADAAVFVARSREAGDLAVRVRPGARGGSIVHFALSTPTIRALPRPGGSARGAPQL